MCVGGGLPTAIKGALADFGLTGFYYSGLAGAKTKKYGNVIASRWALRAHPWRSIPAPPWPQLLASATVNIPGGSVDVIGVHIPNGSSNGWKKIDTFRALAARLRERSPTPTLLAGDFNEPRWAVQEDGLSRLDRNR